MSELTPFSDSDETIDTDIFKPNVNIPTKSTQTQYNGLAFDDDEEEEDDSLVPFANSPEIIDTDIFTQRDNESDIPFSDSNESDLVENYTVIGEQGETIINVPNYIADRQRSKKFLTGGIFGEAGTSGDLSEFYFTRDLTKEDIVNDPVLMEVIRSSLEARYSDTISSKMYSTFTGAMGATTGGLLSRDYRKMSNEKVYDIYMNWMRLFTSGNSITVANELAAAGMFSNDDERAKIGAGYHLFERMDNAFVGRGTYSEMGDAIFDYTRSVVYDPTTFLSFALGKLIYAPVAKAKAEGVKRLMMSFYKNQLSKGVTREQARKKVASAVSRRQVALATTSFAIPDLFFNTGIDLLQQTQLINVDNQEEIDKTRTTITSLMSMGVPAIFGTTSYLTTQFRQSDFLKNSYLGYFDIEESLRKSNKNIEKIIDERVEPNIPQMIDTMDRNFGNIKGDPSKLEAWTKAKEESFNQLKKNKSKDRFVYDLEHTQQFFRDFFFDTVDDTPQKNVITRGYISALKDAGFVFHEDMINKSKISGILGQSIKYLPDNVVKAYMKSFEKASGKSLNLEYTADALAARFINTSSDVGRFANISSVAIQGINREVNDMQVAIKLAANEGELNLTPKTGQWLLSTYKRLLTSHPATTGANLQGFQALAFLDSAAEMASSVIHLGQSGWYKTIGLDPDKATLHANQAYSNFFGATRRGLSMISPQMEVAYARKILDLNEDIKAKLFRDVAGDGGANDGLAMFNLDAKGRIGDDFALLPGPQMFIKGTEAVTKGLQTVALVRMQDEYTKLWAFGNNVNKFIIAEYGVSPTKFFQREDIGAEIITPRFKENVLEKAKFQTLRQTASVNWTQLKKMYGNNFFRRLARGYEFFTNKTPGGFIVPFGSFNNTVVATFADFTGLNFLRNTVQLARGKKLDPESQDMVESIAKAAVGYSYVFYRVFEGENSGLKKVEEGRAYNENRTPEGDLADRQYDWPNNQFDMVAQIIAHGLSGDGRDVLKDIEGMDVAGITEYLVNNFNPKNIPEELLEKLALSVGASAIRDVDRLFTYINNDLGELAKNAEGKEFLFELMATAASRIVQGATRPAEPANMVANMLRFDGKVPDLKQGNVTFNNATRYINSLLPMDLPFGLESPMSLEPKATVTEGTDIRPDVSKMMFGARRTQKQSIGKLMLNSAGINNWDFAKWGGDAKIKNAMDALAAPIFEQIARDKLEEYPNFFKGDLEAKRAIIKEIQTELRKRTEQQLEDLAPKSLSLLRKLTKTANKDNLETVINSLIQGGQLEEGTTISDILEREDAVEIIYQLKFLLDNYNSIYVSPQLEQMR